MDSILVEVRVDADTIFTSNYFQNSQSRLTVLYRFCGEKLLSVEAAEESPEYKDLHVFTTLYYDENACLVNVHRKSTILACMILQPDKSDYEMYGYNPALDTIFIEQYVCILLEAIKNRE